MNVVVTPAASWVAGTFGVTLSTKESPVSLTVTDLVQLALRRNPRRAHLLVSTVLGKHIPVDPRVIAGTGRLLGALVGRVLDSSARDSSALDRDRREQGGPGQSAAIASDQAATRAETALWSRAAQSSVRGSDPGALLDVLPVPSASPRNVLVLGYAETATSLGHFVADQLSADWYLHSTRRPVPGVPVAATFEEGHSHATSHLLLPVPESMLLGDGPVILVDDEISTGRTARATISELHRLHYRPHYVLATLIDLRDHQSELEMAALAEELDIRIDVVSLASGTVELPAGLAGRAAEWIASATPDLEASAVAPVLLRSAAQAPILDIQWPGDLPDGGRHGWSHGHGPAARAATIQAAAVLRSRLVDLVGPNRRILVLGTEEFMYLPLCLALELATDQSLHIEFQTTTRSPVHPVDVSGYPIRRAFSFPSIDTDDSAARFVYNTSRPDGVAPDLVLLMVDDGVEISRLLAPSGPVQALTDGGLQVAVGRIVRTTDAPSPSIGATLPSDRTVLPDPLVGPNFGSYRADEVSWLLTDLSHLDLEGDVAQREQQIQSGQAHYAESLPREFHPDARYRLLFDDVLTASAARLAEAVGLVTELVLAERGHRIVLASLARAGTPVGILMRRWARYRYGIDLPHYAISIVRGRGIDGVALEYLARHHDPGSVVFVDGWTGKGAIAKELSAALVELAAAGGPCFRDDLAVLADPGHCVRSFGTRDDFLIASACLNSTVSGLVSRTVLNPDYLRPDQFHGAKFYRELAGDDVSARLLDAVSQQFPAVVGAVSAGLGPLAGSDREPTFAGWAAVEQIRREYGIDSVNFVKPGVGETTRVLLRRVPWRILLRENNNPDHHHLRLLAEERSVPIEIRSDLPYSCIGLIRPLTPTDRGEG